MGYDAFKLLLKVLAGSVKGISRYIKNLPVEMNHLCEKLYIWHILIIDVIK